MEVRSSLLHMVLYLAGTRCSRCNRVVCQEATHNNLLRFSYRIFVTTIISSKNKKSKTQNGREEKWTN